MVTIPELMGSLTDAVWSDLGGDIEATRRDLQRAYLDRMTELLVDPPERTTASFGLTSRRGPQRTRHVGCRTSQEDDMVVPKVALIGAAEEVRRTLTAAISRLDETWPAPRILDLSTLARGAGRSLALVLIDASIADAEVARMTSLLRGTPSRTLVHLWHHRARDLWRARARAAPPVILIGDEEANRAFGHHLEEALYGDAAAELRSLIGDICDPDQATLVLAFLRRGTRRSTAAIARELNTSERSLRRLCADHGLPTPKQLHRLVRIVVGMSWAQRTGGGLADAVQAARYGDARALRRAAQDTFGCPPSTLAEAWSDPTRLKALLARSLIRG